MIKNERQYRITKAQATKLEQALEHLTTGVVGGTQVHPLLHKAQEDALRSQIADLHSEIEEYEALQSQRHTVLELASFEEFPRALIQARIAAGISQKDLAERLGLKEQQVQRYEATEYASASMTRVSEIIRALGIRMREAILLPGRAPGDDKPHREWWDGDALTAGGCSGGSGVWLVAGDDLCGDAAPGEYRLGGGATL